MKLTGSKLAQLCGISRQAIHKSGLPKDATGKYETENQAIKNFIVSKGVNLSGLKKIEQPKSERNQKKTSNIKPKSEPIPKKQTSKSIKLKQVETKAEKLASQKNIKIKKPVQPKKQPDKKLSTSKVLPVEENEELPPEVKRPTEFIPDENFTPEDFEDITGLPRRMMNMKIFNLVKNYGGPKQLTDWASILQKLMAAQKIDQGIQRERNTLIEKDLTISQVFKYLDEFMKQIFDTAESQTEEIIDLVKSNPDDIRSRIKDMRLKAYSKIAKETKRSITEGLERLKDKYHADNDDSE